MIIDHFHKWRPIINSFESIKIRLTIKPHSEVGNSKEFLLWNEVSKANLNTKEF